jgi:AcrR family transcriptional regulator
MATAYVKKREKGEVPAAKGGREKSGRKREAILDVATKLFLEKGFSATSTNDVCRKAKISKPSLYYFFKSKRHLIFSCHMRSIDQQLSPFLDQASAIPDPDKRIRFMIWDFTRIICKNPELKVLIHETMTIKDQYFKKIRVVWKKHYLLLKATIAELQEKELVAIDLTPSRAALFLLGMMTWITFWFDYRQTQEADGVADTALLFALNGLSYKVSTRLQRQGSSSQREKARMLRSSERTRSGERG